jgi:hypothetical protein
MEITIRVHLRVKYLQRWQNRDGLLASGLFRERDEGESSARVIVAQNFNPSLASPCPLQRFPSRSARFSGPGTGRRARSFETGNKEY